MGWRRLACGALCGLLAVLARPELAAAQLCLEGDDAGDALLSSPQCNALAFGLDGERKDYHDNGELRSVHNVVDALRNGEARWYFANGRPAIEGHFRDDRRDGLWKFWKPDGQPWEEGAYELGRPVGVWRRWQEGEPGPERRFVDGVDSGQCAAGTVAKVVRPLASVEEVEREPAQRRVGYASFCVTTDGVRHGPVVAWAVDGARLFVGGYHHGKAHGEWLRWMEPDVWEVQLWARGKRDAEWERWRHGVRTDLERYRRGKRHGRQRSWHLNGEPALEVRYDQGVPHGNVIAWHDNGEQALIGSFTHGRRDGAWAAWLRNGQLRRRGFYTKGLRTGVWGYWYENGNLYLSGGYRKGDKHGTWTFWHENGNLGQRGECRHGEGVGRWREFDAAGELLRQVDYAEMVEGLWEAEYPCSEIPFLEDDPEEPDWAF